jgi:hypothetical protein
LSSSNRLRSRRFGNRCHRSRNFRSRHRGSSGSRFNDRRNRRWRCFHHRSGRLDVLNNRCGGLHFNLGFNLRWRFRFRNLRGRRNHNCRRD